MAFCDYILFYLHWGWVILTFHDTLTVTKTKWLKLKNTTRYNDHRIERLIQKYMGICFKLWWKILPKDHFGGGQTRNPGDYSPHQYLGK